MLSKDAINEFLLAIKANGRAAATISWYRRSLRPLTEYWPGPIEEVDRHALRGYVAHLRDQPLSPATVAGRVRALKAFFSWLFREGHLPNNPGQAISFSKPRKRPLAVTRKTAAALLAATANPRDRALVWFLVQTGCRSGEVRRLTWSDVDFEDGDIVVVGKGDLSRFIPLAAQTVQALRVWQGFHPGGGHVFCKLHDGGPLTHSGLRQIMERLKRRAGLNGERCNLHSFRHFFAKEYLMNGGDMASLKDLMGHCDISITEEAYVCFTKRDLREKFAKHAPTLAFDS